MKCRGATHGVFLYSGILGIYSVLSVSDRVQPEALHMALAVYSVLCALKMRPNLALHAVCAGRPQHTIGTGRTDAELQQQQQQQLPAPVESEGNSLKHSEQVLRVIRSVLL